jgi:phosphatidylethanolamine/phosphatidyl-N-methylethanolamine N-methyltransferase
LRQPFPAPDRGARVRPRPTLEQRFADEARFIKAWLDNPLVTGAVYPSGKVLSRTMARAVDPAVSGPVVELGPGTGPVTEALIQRGISQDRLILVEFDPDFCRLLARRYPRATIVEGDAYRLARSLGPVLAEPVAAVVSSLPLLTKPEARRLALLEEAFDLMRPEGVFVQFTYGLTSPVPRVDDRFEPTRFSAKGTAPVWLNFPPARVWTYRAADGREESQPKQPPALIIKWKAKQEELGDEWREKRDRVRREFVLRSEKAKAEIRARTEKVKSGLERHQAKIKRAKAEKRPFELFDRSRKGQRDKFW